MSPFLISIPQSTRNTVFCFQKIFTVLPGRPICSWFFRFMRSTHLCKTHARTLMTKKWQQGKNDFSFQITRNSINNCLGTVGIHFNFVTRWLCVSVTTRLCSNWTTQCLGVLRLDRTHGKLPLTSCSIWAGTRAVKGAVGLWKVFALLGISGNRDPVVMKNNLPFWKVHFCACLIYNSNIPTVHGTDPVMWTGKVKWHWDLVFEMIF